MKFYFEYETKKLQIVDFMNHTDGKVTFMIIDNESDEVLHNDRVEYLMYPADGDPHPLLERTVEYFDIHTDGVMCLYVTGEDKND